jgi:D-alanine-D-alanine ligase
MHIGITYDLRDDYLAQGYSEVETAEFDSKQTIDSLYAALRSFGHKVERIGNVKALVKALASGKRWDLVFNICEGMYGIGREAQVPALLDAYSIPYTFSSPDVMVTTMDKSLAKRIVQDAGLPTARFAVAEKDEDISSIRFPYPLFVKPLAEGTGKGVSAASRVETRSELTRACRDVIAQFKQPALVETFLPGREFTVGILGTGKEAEVIGVMETILLADAEAWCYSFANKENYVGRVEYRLVDDEEARLAAQTALKAWQALKCVDCGRIDLRSDARGIPHFLEANPLSGLRPHYSDLPILAEKAGMSYEALIGMIVYQACRRFDLTRVNTLKARKRPAKERILSK